MAVSLIATGGGSAINGGNVTATFTANGIANDVAYVAVTTRSTVDATISTSGYGSPIATSVSGSIKLSIWRKVLTATESSVTVTGNADTGSVTAVSAFVVRGADNFVPEDIISAAATGSSTNPNPPTVTTVTRGNRALVFAGSQVNDTAVTAPSGYGNIAGASNTDTIPSSCWGAFRSTDITAHNTAEDPAAFGNWNTGSWVSFTIILRQSVSDLYWVSGAGTWSSTNALNWALTSGSATVGYIPSGSTNVIFDGGSDSAGAFTVTVSTGASCKNFSTSALDQTMTLAGSAAWSIYGNLTLPATNFTRTYTGAITFASSLTGNTITMNGKTLASALTFDGGLVASSWVLQDALTTSSGITLTTGTLELGIYTLTCSTFASTGVNGRTLNFGTGKVVLTGATATTIWNQSTDLNISGTSLVETTGGGATTKTITATTSESNSVNFSLLTTAGTITFTAGSYIKNLTIANNTFTISNTLLYIYGNFTLNGTNPTISGGTAVLNFSKTSGTQTISTSGEVIDRPITKEGAGTLQLQGALAVGTSTSRTVTLTAGTLDLNSYTLTIYGIFSSDNSNTRRIENTGGLGKIVSSLSPGVTTTVWLTTTTTNMTTDGNVIAQFTNGTAGRSIIIDSGTLSETNAISFQFSGTASFSFTNNNTVKDLIFDDTGYELTNRILTIYGNLSLPAIANGTNILGGANGWTFASTSGTKTISSAGETLNSPIVFNGIGGAWQLTTDVASFSTRTTTLTAGTLDLNSFTWTSGGFSITGAGTKVLAHGTGGILTISGAGATAFNNTGSNFSFTGTGTINMNSGSAKTFVGNSNSYATLNQGGAGTLTITGSNTFQNITNSGQPATILFTAGTTQTFTDGFALSGTSGNLITIGSVTPTSTFTLSKASGTVDVSFCSISDSIATGGATWNALLTNGNVDGGNNSGWIFAVAVLSAAFLLLF